LSSWLVLGHLCLPLSGYIWTMNSSGFFPFTHLCVLYPTSFSYWSPRCVGISFC
jgi:hypothetical protein